MVYIGVFSSELALDGFAVKRDHVGYESCFGFLQGPMEESLLLAPEEDNPTTASR